MIMYTSHTYIKLYISKQQYIIKINEELNETTRC